MGDHVLGGLSPNGFVQVLRRKTSIFGPIFWRLVIRVFHPGEDHPAILTGSKELFVFLEKEDVPGLVDEGVKLSTRRFGVFQKCSEFHGYRIYVAILSTFCRGQTFPAHGIYVSMGTFREFINKHDRRFQLREQEAAPAGGSAPPPSDPEKKTSEPHLDFLGKELNAQTEDLEAAIQSGPLTLYGKIPDYSGQWGFKILPPIQAGVKKVGDDQFEVTFPFVQMYAQNRNQFVTFRDGVMYYYQGPVRNEKVVMTREELMNAWAEPLAGGGGGPMGGPPGGMGGAPPIGGM
jgi:hypothetical protein